MSLIDPQASPADRDSPSAKHFQADRRRYPDGRLAASGDALRSGDNQTVSVHSAADRRERRIPQLQPTPEAMAAVAAAQRAGVGVENAEERTIVLRQMYVGLMMIVGGAAVATVGIVLVKESDSTKLTAIIALATAVIGAGAALLPTGAAAGASARILSRPQVAHLDGFGFSLGVGAVSVNIEQWGAEQWEWLTPAGRIRLKPFPGRLTGVGMPARTRRRLSSSIRSATRRSSAMRCRRRCRTSVAAVWISGSAATISWTSRTRPACPVTGAPPSEPRYATSACARRRRPTPWRLWPRRSRSSCPGSAVIRTRARPWWSKRWRLSR